MASLQPTDPNAVYEVLNLDTNEKGTFKTHGEACGHPAAASVNPLNQLTRKVVYHAIKELRQGKKFIRKDGLILILAGNQLSDDTIKQLRNEWDREKQFLLYESPSPSPKRRKLEPKRKSKRSKSGTKKKDDNDDIMLKENSPPNNNGAENNERGAAFSPIEIVRRGEPHTVGTEESPKLLLSPRDGRSNSRRRSQTPLFSSSRNDNAGDFSVSGNTVNLQDFDNEVQPGIDKDNIANDPEDDRARSPLDDDVFEVPSPQEDVRPPPSIPNDLGKDNNISEDAQQVETASNNDGGNSTPNDRTNETLAFGHGGEPKSNRGSSTTNGLQKSNEDDLARAPIGDDVFGVPSPPVPSFRRNKEDVRPPPSIPNDLGKDNNISEDAQQDFDNEVQPGIDKDNIANDPEDDRARSPLGDDVFGGPSPPSFKEDLPSIPNDRGQDNNSVENAGNNSGGENGPNPLGGDKEVARNIPSMSSIVLNQGKDNNIPEDVREVETSARSSPLGSNETLAFGHGGEPKSNRGSSTTNGLQKSNERDESPGENDQNGRNAALPRVENAGNNSGGENGPNPLGGDKEVARNIPSMSSIVLIVLSVIAIVISSLVFVRTGMLIEYNSQQDLLKAEELIWIQQRTSLMEQLISLNESNQELDFELMVLKSKANSLQIRIESFVEKERRANEMIFVLEHENHSLKKWKETLQKAIEVAESSSQSSTWN